ncbi:MAG: hypothetical protein ACJ75B_03480, partial [Flavisolibacter sp.]
LSPLLTINRSPIKKADSLSTILQPSFGLLPSSNNRTVQAPPEAGEHSAFSIFDKKPFDYKTNKNLW